MGIEASETRIDHYQYMFQIVSEFLEFVLPDGLPTGSGSLVRGV